ncbi:DnaJ domain-containing protein, partial [Radiomyces spectabilis]|uniref:DnaJ domain-containing protein n=1 Tax=Radiomyces spectabilis TaxID=64574 RepID=UPI0022207965
AASESNASSTANPKANRSEPSVSKSDAPSHTPEQAKSVQAILACGTDYYKVLSVDKSCTEIQLKKAYRKLALQFHPDKNKAPGADEAFKLISKAFTVLSDPQKRAIHDAGGGDPEQRGHGGAGFPGFGHAYTSGAHFGGEDISPEELFNLFFGGGGGGFGGPGFSSATFVGPGFRTQTYYTNAGAGRRAQTPSFTSQTAASQSRSSAWTILLQILPLLLLFSYSLLSGFFSDTTPLFSFQPTSVYSEPRMTQSHYVRYYVDPSAFSTIETDVQKFARLEQQVEMDWVRGLQASCQNERREQASRLKSARGFMGMFRNEQSYQTALHMPMQSCEEIKKFG